MSERKEYWVCGPSFIAYECEQFDENNQSKEQVHVREVWPGDQGMLDGYEKIVNQLEQLECKHAELIEAAREVDGYWSTMPTNPNETQLQNLDLKINELRKAITP